MFFIRCSFYWNNLQQNFKAISPFINRKRKAVPKAKASKASNDGDSDSRSSTPTLKGGDKSLPSTPSSSQDSSSDVPKKKKSKVDATVETVKYWIKSLLKIPIKSVSQ